MKEGSEVFSCVFVCSVCVCMMGGPGSDSVVSVSPCQDGKWPPAVTSLTILWTFAESNKLLTSLLSLKKKQKQWSPRVCGWWIFPSWSLLRHFLGVWDHFRLLDVPFLLLCLRNHVTMYPPHTVLISMLLLICTKSLQKELKSSLLEHMYMEEKNTTFF